MEEIKVSEMLQADSINKDDSVMIIQEGVNKKASGSIQTATGTSLSLTSVADTCKVKSNSVNLFDKDTAPIQSWIFDTTNTKIVASANGKSTYIPCKASTTYTISKISAFRFQVATTSTTPAIDVAYSDYIENNDGTTITITTGASAQYIVIYYWHPNSGIAEQLVLDSLQLELGSTATSYNPYNTKVIIADGDVSSPTIEAGTIQQATGQNATGSRMRSAGYIDVEPNKEYTLNADGNTAVVFEYKSDNTYIHRIPDNWIKTPYTFTTTSETAKVRFVTESPNVTQDQIAFQEGSQSQEITLIPQEEKTAYTYNTKTGILSDGSVTIEYNTQSRLLNNDDTTAIKEYVDRTAEEKNQNIYSTDEIVVGKWIDGKPLYRKVVNFGALPNNASKTIAHNISNLDEVITLKGMARYSTARVPIPIQTSTGWMSLTIQGTNISINTNTDRSTYTTYVIIEYTKTTD